MAQVIWLVAAALSGIFTIIFFYHWRRWAMNPAVTIIAQVAHIGVVLGLLVAAGLIAYV